MEDNKSTEKIGPNNPESTTSNIYIICGILATIILAIDSLIPLGVAGGVPYIAVVLLSLKSPNKSFTLLTAIICSLFVLIGFFASPDGGQMWQVIANRFLALFAIWTTAVLALMQRSREHELHDEQLKNQQAAKDLEIQKEKLKVLKATMRTVQDIVGNFLNNLHIIRIEVEDKKTLSAETLDKLDEIVHDTSNRLTKLGNLDRVREKLLARDMVGIDYESSATDPTENTVTPSDINSEKK